MERERLLDRLGECPRRGGDLPLPRSLFGGDLSRFFGGDFPRLSPFFGGSIGNGPLPLFIGLLLLLLFDAAGATTGFGGDFVRLFCGGSICNGPFPLFIGTGATGCGWGLLDFGRSIGFSATISGFVSFISFSLLSFK